MAGGDDFVDEGRPVVRPLLLENGDEDEIELVKQGSLRLKRLFRGGALNDEVDDKVANTYARLA